MVMHEQTKGAESGEKESSEVVLDHFFMVLSHCVNCLSAMVDTLDQQRFEKGTISVRQSVQCLSVKGTCVMCGISTRSLLYIPLTE